MTDDTNCVLTQLYQMCRKYSRRYPKYLNIHEQLNSLVYFAYVKFQHLEGDALIKRVCKEVYHRLQDKALEHSTVYIPRRTYKRAGMEVKREKLHDIPYHVENNDWEEIVDLACENDLQRRIVGLYVQGHSLNDISGIIGISQMRVRNAWRKFKHAYKEYVMPQDCEHCKRPVTRRGMKICNACHKHIERRKFLLSLRKDIRKFNMKTTGDEETDGHARRAM